MEGLLRTAAAVLNAWAVLARGFLAKQFHPYNLAAFFFSRLWRLRRVLVGNDERSARRYKETVKTFHERGISHGRREDVAYLGAFFGRVHLSAGSFQLSPYVLLLIKQQQQKKLIVPRTAKRRVRETSGESLVISLSRVVSRRRYRRGSLTQAVLDNE